LALLLWRSFSRRVSGAGVGGAFMELLVEEAIYILEIDLGKGMADEKEVRLEHEEPIDDCFSEE
jgi:hypothetical protein